MRKIHLATLVALLGVACGASAQTVRIEAEAGAAGLLQVAIQDLANATSKPAAGNVSINSTAAALAKLCRGEIALAGTARTITKQERDLCAQNKLAVVEVPVATDAIAIVANPQNTWAKQISVAELKRAWIEAPAKAASWDQLNAQWPHKPLKLYGPAPRLGLATNYRVALTSVTNERIRSDISSTEVLSVVVEGVARDVSALGVLDWATYSANAKRIRVIPVEGSKAGGLTFPVSLYVTNEGAKAPAVKALVEHVLARGERLSKQAGLTPLSAAEYQHALQRLSAVQ